MPRSWRWVRRAAAEWCRAFDPLLRAQDIAASVYFETATNDKFFSLDMAMATWRALPNRNFLALRHNQDHTMNPFGQQPYAIEAIERAGNADVLAPARAMNDKHFSFVRDGAEEICWPVDDAEFGSVRLAVSEQLAGRGDMSREWRLVAPRTRANRTAVFPTGESAGAGSTSLFYLTREFAVGGRRVHAATPVHRREGAGEPALDFTRDLLPDPAQSVWEAAFGDKTSPVASNVDGGFGFAFTGEIRQRTTRFGIRPWLLPRDWQAIEIECGVRPDDAGELWLFLSTRYNELAESSVVQRFADAAIEGSGDGVRMRFGRERFRAARHHRAALRPAAAARSGAGAGQLRCDRRRRSGGALHRAPGTPPHASGLRGWRRTCRSGRSSLRAARVREPAR